ncbi:type II secretion system F family protein [Haloimpatiens lingqiaonensis]|uniref:type II secretion system F family protein n=1 Tax=Haloimpatiens lingqiaonensis TaxID=1380675 RepID=UPI0010FD5832|nr:type II secretion system F family protein [Haloimpatiens lingqiaonensis]
MPTYKYKVMNSEGKKLEGSFKGANRNEVLAMIQDNNYYPISIEEISEISEKDVFENFKKVSTRDLYIFCRQFHTMINAGANIATCINTLKMQSSNVLMRKALNQVYEDIQKGITLSEALKKKEDIFPELLINMVETGEASGKLDLIMERMAAHYERENKINNKIKNAMIYPIILCVLSIGIVTFLVTFIMPIFIDMFQGSGVPLPLPTRISLAISSGIRKNWYIIIAVIAMIVFIVKTYSKSENGKLFFHNLKLKNFLTKDMNTKIITARFTRTLSTLLYSGIPLIQSIEITAKVLGNKVVENRMEEVKNRVVKGENLSDSLKEVKLFPPMLMSMIKIGEESGALDDILDKTANFYDEELDAALKRMTAMMEPLMILIMGVIIGFIVISMMMPMFDVFNTIPT